MLTKCGIACPDLGICSNSWRIEEQEKWQTLIEEGKEPFSMPLTAYVGKSYNRHGIVVVGMNFNKSSKPWDATQGPYDNDRLAWRNKGMYPQIAKFLVILLNLPESLIPEMDHYYSFLNIVKCSPTNEFSKNSYPNITQIQRCVARHQWVKHEILELEPLLVFCLGDVVFDQIIAVFIEERIKIELSCNQQEIKQINRKTYAIRIPHLSGGLQTINTENKKYRDDNQIPSWAPELATKTHSQLEQELHTKATPIFQSNVLFTYKISILRDDIINCGVNLQNIAKNFVQNDYKT